MGEGVIALNIGDLESSFTIIIIVDSQELRTIEHKAVLMVHVGHTIIEKMSVLQI
jgi:hypothetical protein